ncbi:glycosyltransferase family 4 protein [Candidatus Nomurabacteria bacterium]|nr:glycosyltransferase family 4 protein [Candidatus Nomurabacteria bacterium]
MRIGIDARMMGKGYGLARYVEQLVLFLGKMDTDNEYVLFVNEQLQAEHFGSNFSQVLCDIPWYSVAEQLKMPGIIKKADVNVMHFPHWNVPMLYPGAYVVTIHDLTMYHYPRPDATTLGPVRYFIKDKLHRVVVKNAVKKAKKVIVTSEFTKQDVHKTLGTPMEKMYVTYQAPFELVLSNKTIDLEKFGITKPFAMYVGSAYPHKNLNRLIEAWEQVREATDDAYQLVLVGKKTSFYEKLFDNVAIQRFGNSIIYTDFLDDDQLSDLYQKSRLYVFPSLYEGFGLPPLEAMMHKIPVVSSMASCLPEVLADAALYFDPENVDHMAHMILQGLEDEDIRLELVQNGQKQCKLYSWDTLAKKTHQMYTEISSQ